MHNRLLIAAACLLALLSTIGASLPFPILAPLFAGTASNEFNHFLGLPPKLLLGFALAVNPLGLLIGSALMGPLSDRYGRRPLLLVTTCGAAAGHALSAMALLAGWYPLFIVARFATGLLAGNNAVARAMIADRLDGPLRLRALSWLNGAVYLGWFAGPLLSGFTLDRGVGVPFWIAVGALLLCALLVAVVLPREAASGETTPWWRVARERHALNLLRHAEPRRLFVVQLAYTCGVTSFYEFFPLWLVEVPGYGPRGIAWVNAGLCFMMTLTAVFAGGPSRFEPLRRVVWFASLAALAIALVALGNVWVGLAAIMLFGVPNAYYNAVMQGWCVERFGAHGQGAVMGLLATTFCLANIIMGLAGAVLTQISTSLILALGACLSAWAAWRLRGWREQMARPALSMEASK
ncbi:MFS transporter [Massilia glaciei]|uniref:MFS transporter n=1 Tax=Massilia glaciei TaxID=1524097 RepID=A0A2U2I6J9_9BURK|nr:MFS transporter [Massilia glaciei]PWF55380.1 MFS transporter [Massilia glaciei]